MRILYHHRTRGAAVEGVHIRSIANALRAKGHDVDIMSFPGADPEEHQTANVSLQKPNLSNRIISFITKRFPEFAFELLELAYNVLAGIRLLKYIFVQKPDAIYERYSLFMFITVFIAKIRKIPIVLEINDSALLLRVRPLLFKGLAKWIESWIFRNSSGLMFISSYFLNVAKDAYGDIAPCIISPNAADISMFTPSEEKRKSVRVEYGIEDKIVCGFVGAFLPWHGIESFIKEVAVSLKETPNLVLLLVGDGPLYEQSLNFVKKHGVESQVVFTGRVPHEQVSALMSAMDYAILPDSNTYGSPMKLFESMAMAVPMVCPDYDPVTDIVKDNETGWLFKAKNQAQAVDKVIALSRDPEQLKQVGQAARDYIINERQWSHNATDLVELYRKVGSAG